MIGMISCKEATYLVSKKEQGKITIAERIRLSLHLMICKFCKRFEKQNKIITEHAKRLEHVLYNEGETTLPDSYKEHIRSSVTGNND
ncbi:MAG: hypothetical protein KDC07_07835 [Chitinophagaceae bacterium]|nr:hypothetical protein [Chitinophagaceae bacterium]